jgi:tRNA A37 threonylcarbamoyladenosine synthetase subunit TsaC/SUA5/YrdC
MEGRIDIEGDAKKVVDTIEGGGVVILPGDIAYALTGSTAGALNKSFAAKGRAAHKKHGMLGNWDLHRELHVVNDRGRVILETLCLDFKIPVGIVAPFRRDHPVLRNLDDETLDGATYKGTIGMLVNNGPLYEASTRLAHSRSIPMLGSSANLSGMGAKARLQDIEQPIRDVADLEFDYGLTKFSLYKRASTMIDFSGEEPKVIRIGVCYDVISSILGRFFGITDLPVDPGIEALPSGHLNPEQTRY